MPHDSRQFRADRDHLKNRDNNAGSHGQILPFNQMTKTYVFLIIIMQTEWG